MKVAACVILYHPDFSVERNIQSYLPKVDKVFIIDNTESGNSRIKLLNLPQSKIIVVNDGNNEGIAKRLNQTCELAIKEGFEYLLTMDQDSFFDENAIALYLACIDLHPDKNRVSMFGVNYQCKISRSDCNFKKVDYLITSGSIINLSVYKKIGSFDENLFIDFVDSEYCLNSSLKGYDIAEYENIFLNHSLGESSEKRSLLTLKKTKRSFHSSLRLYYMTRNFLYINKKYKSHFKEQMKIFKADLLNRIKNKLLYQPGRIKTLQYLFKAIQDYRKNKMGKLPD